MSYTVGFLTVRRHLQHGYFGGYLVVNQLARPLEFHCTLPIQPSRAQTLLYGPTLDDFVCGEQIAKALIIKAKIKPDLVITDSRAALAVSLVTELPVLALEAADEDQPAAEHLRLPTQSQLLTRTMESGSRTFTVAEQTQSDCLAVKEALNSLAAKFDLSEPFCRIVEALVEAHPIAKAA